MLSRWEGVSYLEVLIVVNGCEGNKLAMLKVYHVEGKVRAALAQKTGSGLGEGVRGPTRQDFQATHLVKDNRYNGSLLKRRAASAGDSPFDWLVGSVIAISRLLELCQFFSRVSTFHLTEACLRHKSHHFGTSVVNAPSIHYWWTKTSLQQWHHPPQNSDTATHYHSTTTVQY